MSKIQVPLSILTLVGFLVFLNACTSQNEQDKFPVKLAPGAAVTCYTGTEPSYKIDVKPLIVSKCNACHAADVAAGAGGGYIYETYDQISANAIVIMQRVQLPATGDFNLMPQGGPKLDSCSIAIIKTWADNGKKNN